MYVNHKNLKIAPYQPPMHLQIGLKVFSVISKLHLIDNDSTIIIFIEHQIIESQESSTNTGYDSGFSSFSSMFMENMDIEQDSIIAKNTLLETQTIEATGKI